MISDKEDRIAELEKIKVYFEAIISRPKKNLPHSNLRFMNYCPMMKTQQKIFIQNLGQLGSANFQMKILNMH